MVIVAHDIPTLRQLCSRGVFLEKGRVQWDGAIDVAADLFREKRRAWRAANGLPVAPAPAGQGK